MKVFALIMLRCALLMLLSSLLQNGTLATLGEWETSCHKLKEWKESCHLWVSVISISLGSITSDDLSNIPNINHSLDVLLYEVNNFPLEGMDELKDRRLQKSLKMAISNCDKLLNKVEHSGLEDNQKYLETLVSKTSSIAKGLRTEFNTFSFEVELELFTKFYRTLQKRFELSNKLLDFVQFATDSYSDVDYFVKEWTLLSVGMGNNPRYEPGTPEFVDFVESLILNAKLKILETECYSKIAMFAQRPHIDGDGFLEFSKYFKVEWKLIEQMIGQLTSNDDKDTFRKRLDDLAEKAMEETVPLKAISTEKFDQLITKCLVSTKEKVKNAIMKPFKSEQKKQKEEEAKKKEIYAMKEIISDIGMFDGAAKNYWYALNMRGWAILASVLN